MLRKLLLLSVCAHAAYAATGTDTTSGGTVPQQAPIVRKAPDLDTLERCINTRIAKERRMWNHDTILQKYAGKYFSDGMEIVLAERKSVYGQREELEDLAAAIQDCSNTRVWLAAYVLATTQR